MRKIRAKKKGNVIWLGLLLLMLCGACLTAQASEETVQAENETETVIGTGEEEEQGIYSLLLIGVDRRDDSWAGNSDSMILVTVNDEKQQVSMISLMRDTGVEVPGCGLHKLNYAHAYGGADLLLETINQNYELDLDRYISVDFDSMIEIVDAAGGVELTLSDAEAENANSYISAMCESQGISADSYLFPGGGTYHCGGMRAVGYSRIRYVGNSDYERTERQRTVMTKLLEKLKEMDSAELLSFSLKAAASVVDYNIPMTELIELVGRAPEVSGYELVSDRIPYDGLYYSQNEMLMPDWGETIARMKETIY